MGGVQDSGSTSQALVSEQGQQEELQKGLGQRQQQAGPSDDGWSGGRHPLPLQLAQGSSLLLRRPRCRPTASSASLCTAWQPWAPTAAAQP